MDKHHFEDPDEGFDGYLFETIERLKATNVGTYTWTFICFALARRSGAQSALILLDALLREHDAEGMFEYGEAGGLGWFRSRAPFKREFGFKVRIASTEYRRDELSWFLEEADTWWLKVIGEPSPLPEGASSAAQQ